MTRSAGAMSDFDSNPFADPDLNNPFKVSAGPRPWPALSVAVAAEALPRGSRVAASPAPPPAWRVAPGCEPAGPRAWPGAEPGRCGRHYSGRRGGPRGGGWEAGAPGLGCHGDLAPVLRTVMAEVYRREARVHGRCDKKIKGCFYYQKSTAPRATSGAARGPFPSGPSLREPASNRS